MRLPCLLVFLALPAALAETAWLGDGPRAVMSLDGEWEVHPAVGLDLAFPPPADGWSAEAVPQPSSPSISTVGGPYMPDPKDLLNADGTGFRQTEKTAAWYRRRFVIDPVDLAGRRAVLVFHGAAFRSTAWLNGRELGTSYQCAVPFEYDVTDALAAGDNELVVGLTGREGIVDMARRTYVTPCNGMMGGLWGSVEVHLRPAVSVDDVFLRPSVRESRLDVDITVRNDSPASRGVRPRVVAVDAAGVPRWSAAGEPLTVTAGQTATARLGGEWAQPQLWSPETPVLYQARVSLDEDGAEVDRRTERFGFREFEIRGRDFYLNGTRTVLLRNSTLTALGQPLPAGFANMRRNAGQPYNSVRLHLGQNNVAQLDACDQLGLMAIPEASFSWVKCFPSAASEAWLPNTLEYYRRWIRLHRNRPSVVAWSLCNETYWDSRRPEDMALAERILAEVQRLDPTRPQQGDGETSWDGRLPTINIHYPESEAGEVRRAFPNSGLVVPNDLWWLSDEGANRGWRAEFTWDRPLMLGEYWWTTGPPDVRSSYLGDRVYDFETWRLPDSPERIEPDEDMATLQKASDYYRVAGVACLNPWSGNRELFLRPVDVRPLDYHPNAFAGEPFERKTVVFNDSGNDYYDLHLQCRLAVDGRTTWQEVVKLSVPPGTHRLQDLTIPMPATSTPTTAALTVRLRYWRAGGYHELGRFEETLHLVPRPRLADVDAAGLVLLDATGATRDALARMGLELTPAETVTTDSLREARAVIVGEDTDASAWADALRAFVEGGGRVVVLRQREGRPLARELPEADPQHAASMAWPRAPHPVLAGLDEHQLRWWRPNHRIAERTLQKPTTGRFRVLLASGGRYGMQWSPLSEVRSGQGTWLVTQLHLADRVEVEPLAGELLARLLRYAVAYEPIAPRPLRLLAGGNDALRQTLDACSVITADGLDGDGPVLVDGSATLTAEQRAALKAHLAGGGTVWLHGLTPETLGGVAELFPFEPELGTYDDSVQAGAVRSDDPLMSGIGNFDLHWTRVDMGSRADIFQDGQPTAKLGEHPLVLPSLEAGEPLTEPALLVKVPVGPGTVLFDNLAWEAAFGAESGKVSRLVSSLVTSLGGDIRLATEPAYDWFHVDLAPHVNMGYYDPVAGDEQGGWTDQGENDMRFFLINHTGRAGGRDDAPEVGTEAWPALASFAGKPFRLVDPTVGNRKGVVALRGGDHGAFLPGQVTDIAVSRRADRLWFLHTACWAVADRVHAELGRYVVHYADGTTATVPLRYGLELQDWWNPGPLPGSEVGWTGRNLAHAPIGVWVTPWDNPQPDKVIESIDLVGNLSGTQIVLLGITGGVIEGGAAERVTSRWSLAAAADGVVPNQVPDAPPLQRGESAPTPFSADGHAGLAFSGGQSLSAPGRQVPPLADGGPFSLEMTLAVDAPPPGYMGGLFECMQYRQNGFRLVVYQNLTLGAEIYAGPDQSVGLRGRTALEPGRFYRVRLQFDAQRAQLYLDGKLDGSADTPPPAPCPQPARIGTASGKDYHLEGRVEEVVIRVPVG